MPKYIDREALLAEFEWLKSVEDPYQRDRTEDAIQRIKNAPVADVVPVVRCKNCKYFVSAMVNANGFLICDISDMEIAPDDFCSYGERREE